MKKLLKKLFGTKPPLRKYYSLNDLDQKIEKHLDYNNGFFIELGANDGVNQSNTLYFEKHRNWKGILIEPTPHQYLACRKNRSENNHIYCAAYTSFEYKEKFVEIIYSNLMSTPLGLESDIHNPAEHAELGKQFLDKTEDNFIFGALAKTLNELMIQSNAPHMMDLLSLDVEGAEIEVLKGIDHTDYRFKFLCIESRSKEKLEIYLKTVGYQLIETLSFHDYLFENNI